jgi:UDP-2,3-diacylglucosamine pyrophosphatase LpxH
MDAVNGIPVRTLLVSDVHLGSKHAQPNEFLDFIRSFAPRSLYIVGDFIDGWKINSGWHWTKSCDHVIAHVIDLARRGTKVHYVPGNHDSFLRNSAVQAMLPTGFPAFNVADEFIFESLSGYRLLVTHGDRFDFFETRAQWVSKATAGLYDACLSLNWWFHRLLLSPRHNPYGVCAMLKDRVKRGVKFVSNFESQIMQHARLHSCEGVICGHIHTPSIVHSDVLLYLNTGDWVENCTGLVEHHDGTIQLLSRFRGNQELRLPWRRRSQVTLPACPVVRGNLPDVSDAARDGLEDRPNREEVAA